VSADYGDYDEAGYESRHWPRDHWPKQPEPRTLRAAVLDDAKQAVCSDRNAEYGEPIDNLGRWAEAVNGLGYRVLVPGSGGAAWRELKPHDMAVIMGVGKYARLMHSPEKADHWVDAAGYPAIGFECVTLEDQ
jgi:Domain of unknown function (DUF6378)